MKTFKQFYLLREKLEKADIINLYIVMSMPRPSDPANQFIADGIIAKSKQALTNELEDIVLEELAHIEEESEIMTSLKDEKSHYKLTKCEHKLFDDLNITIPNSGSMSAIYNYINKDLHRMSVHDYRPRNAAGEFTLNEFNKAHNFNYDWNINAVITLFDCYNNLWGRQYGGHSWGKIASMLKELKSSSVKDTQKMLDRIVDYVHNTGSLLNKFKGYDEGWLQYILDLKQHTKNIRTLFPYADMKEIKPLLNDPEWRLTMLNTPEHIPSADVDKIKTNSVIFMRKLMAIINDFKAMNDYGKVKEMMIDMAEHVNSIFIDENPVRGDHANDTNVVLSPDQAKGIIKTLIDNSPKEQTDSIRNMGILNHYDFAKILNQLPMTTRLYMGIIRDEIYKRR